MKIKALQEVSTYWRSHKDKTIEGFDLKKDKDNRLY